MLTECGQYLRDQNQWQLKTEKVFELHLAKKSQHFEDHRYETIQIADINKDILENQHRIVLILGEPGSGKTTFAHQLWQQWKNGEEFKQYTCAILVHLRHPRIQEAQSISELLPYGDRETANVVANAMTVCDGRNILWILDGWDELSVKSEVHDSIIREMVTQESPLPQSTVIITTCTCVLPLREINFNATLHVTITGFTEQGLIKYFNELLLEKKSNISTDDVLKQIRSKPSINSICHLPLYAQMIIDFVINSEDKKLVSCTKYGLLVPFIFNLVQPQLDKSLTTLPTKEKEFKSLCHSAYETLKEKTLSFEQENILTNSYGLLSRISSLIPGEGELKLYEFKHLCIQEYLAALHCHINNDEDSNNGVNLLIDLHRINHPGFRTMVQMYSSITKLESPYDDRFVTEMVELVESVETLEKRMSLLISLLHCLYEAQNPSKCVLVATKLKSGMRIERTLLNQSDCIALAYFLRSMDRSTRGSQFNVTLSYVELEGSGFDILVQVLKQPTYSKSHDKKTNILQHMKGAIALLFNHTPFTIDQQSGEGLTELLTERQLLTKLYINGCPSLSDSGTLHIAKGLMYNEGCTNTLRELHLVHCRITNEGVEHLSLALQKNKTLEILNLRYNEDIGDKSFMHLGDVLKNTTTLKELNLLTCLNVTDFGLSQLACSLTCNQSLVKLHIGDQRPRSQPEKITERGLLIFFMMLSLRKERPPERFELCLSHDLQIICEEDSMDETDPEYCYTIDIYYYIKGTYDKLAEDVVNHFVITTKPRNIHICTDDY